MQVQQNTQASKTSSPSSSTKETASSSVPAQKPILTPPSALNHVPAVGQAQTPGQKVEKPIITEKELEAKFGKLKKPNSKKQIPTILGLLILFVALISGVLLFGQGTGVFAPRATPETTPKNIRISNVTDKTFTISFYTDESTVAFVKYGEDEKNLDKQASDDRDQLSGVVKDYQLHHITVRSLSPGKNYFYVLGTGTSTFDNEGNPYSLATAAKPSQSPTNNQTIYGSVLNADKSPAEGAVVYLYSEGMGALSSLVKSSGSWGISLSNAFNTEKTNYLTLTDDSAIEIKVQGVNINAIKNLTTKVSAAQPTEEITLGLADASESEQSAVASDAATIQESDKAELLAENDINTSGSGDFASSTESTQQAAVVVEELVATSSPTPTVASSAAEPEVLDLSNLSETASASAVTIQTSQPQIQATLPANTMVRIVIHSNTTIDETVQTDANGNMILDVASLGQNLEPGQHTASYTYIDPVTGKEVTKTYNFTVDPKAPRQLAAAADLNMSASKTPTPTATKSPTPIPSIPYGSGNPYMPSVSVTATPTASATPTISTRSAVVATTSGQYNSGSIGATIALLLGGLFFVLAGVWSYFLATSFDPKNGS